jgi:hypothetical protein
MSIVERVFRWIEMVGVAALFTIAIKSKSPALAEIVGGGLGCLAGLYFVFPAARSMERRAVFMSSKLSMTALSFGASLIVCASGYLTSELAPAIEAAIRR